MFTAKQLFSKAKTAIRLGFGYVRQKKMDRLVSLAESSVKAGNPSQALRYCTDALSLDPFPSGPYHFMAELLMPGDNYLELLARFHAHIIPSIYLEVGVSTGSSLALSGGAETAVGIDPRPCIRYPLTSNCVLYPMTSDEFFQTHDPATFLNGCKPDLVFVDGLHTFEQVLKDIANVERYSSKSTVVLVHDCLPVSKRLATREPSADLWCGDVWKIIPCLAHYRPDLIMSVIPTQPSGLMMLTNLDSGSTVISDKWEEIITSYIGSDLEYEHLDFDQNSLFRYFPNVIQNDWQKISERIPRRSRDDVELL